MIGHLGDGVFPAGESVNGAVQHVALFHEGHAANQRFHDFFTGVRRDEYPRLTIVDDVVHLLLLKAPANCSEINTSALSRPANLEKARMVLEQYGDVIATLQSQGTEQLSTLVSTGFKLRKGNGFTGFGHYVSRLVRMGGSNLSWTHVFLP